MGCFGAKGQKLSCSETRGLGCGTPFPPPSTLLVDYWPWGVPDVTISGIVCSNCHVQDSNGPSSNGVPRSTAPGGTSNPDKKLSCGTQCPNPQSLNSGPLTQKQNGLRTMEAKRDAKRMSAKEVTINVTDSIRQVDRNRRMAKNCVN
uniref:BAALC binder of MAP3K1 and KLF4 n=1 Tax=Ursus maritimus TaxID=29073 RepID=A0A452V1G5_URSMA